jgi:CheY-like chemotaxis protein
MPTTEHPTGRPVSPARVLLVENDFLIAETVADQLAELGYALVGPANSLAEATRLAASEFIDAALLDWRLDGVTSDAVADILLERHIPFTFLTGYTEIADGRYRNVPLLKNRGRPEGRQAEHWRMALSEFERENRAPNIAKVAGSPVVAAAPGTAPKLRKKSSRST